MYSRAITTAANAKLTDWPTAILATPSGSNYTCYEVSDYFSSTIPAGLGTVLLEGPVTLDSRFVGIHTQTSAASLFQGGWNRSHDMAPRWAQWNPSSGVFDFTSMLAWLQASKAAGQETVVTVFSTPTWASARPAEANGVYPSDVGGLAEPANMANLSTAITALMNNCGSLIDYLEVWNEPKYQTGNKSFFSGTPAKLAEIAKTINQAAKAIKPSVKIMGVACTGINNNAAGGGIDYTNQFLQASDGATGTGKDWIDILSVHTYEHSGNNYLPNLPVAKTYLATMMSNNGISSMPIWSTEWGYITPQFDTYTGPSISRANALFRYLMYNIVMGMTRCSLYAYGHPIGWNNDPIMLSAWKTFALILNGATVQRINLIGANGQLACTINNTTYLV